MPLGSIHDLPLQAPSTLYAADNYTLDKVSLGEEENQHWWQSYQRADRHYVIPTVLESEVLG